MLFETTEVSEYLGLPTVSTALALALGLERSNKFSKIFADGA